MADSRIDELRRRLERDPGSRLFAQLAEELRKAGDLEEAITVARRGLEQHPAYPSARLTLGRALLDSGDPAGARTELETAARGAPDNILANRLLAETLESLGDLGGALRQYEATLKVAPGDLNVEGRMRDLQSRLKSGGAAGKGDSPEVTSPMAAVAPAPPSPPAPPRPAVAAGSDAGPEDEHGEGPPPTIRIRAPGEPPLPPRAMARPAGGPPGDVTAPPLTAPGHEMGQPPGAARPPSAETTLPAELPARGQPLGAPRGEAPAGGAEGGAAGPGRQPAGLEPEGGAPDDESDLAPTLPTAAGVPVEEELPPTLPPRAKRGAAESPPATVRPESVPPRPEAEAAAPFSSATLAELYFQQGLLERAVEVYRQVLEEEPGNERARQRLAEVETLVAAGASSLPVPALDAGDDRAARRRALERTIELLEGLLAVLRRR